MLKTRKDVENYALRICVPMLEAAAERRLSRRPAEVVDTIGYVPTLLEELFRPFWGITPILRDGGRIYLRIRGERVELGDWLREVLITGTDPDSEFSWDVNREYVGEHSFHFQNITELAGLLVGMYFAREATWERLKPDEQQRVADWSYAASEKLCIKIAGNNHIWFPLLCLLVLKKFGFDYPDTDRFMREGMERLDSMYVGGGWYSDGDFGRIDYYEAWSMHAYPLLWCLIEDESFDGYAARRAMYLERTRLFLHDFAKFFDRDGAYPPFGRSLSYRFAAVCVFPLAVLCGIDFDPALAGEITLRNISYFEENLLTGADDILPPGFMYNSPALVENYTSSGGSYWAAKSFLCLLLDEDHTFWRGGAKLPIDEGEYIQRPSDPRLNFVFAGEAGSGVTIYNNHFQYYQNGRYCNPFNDMAGYYDKFAYNSRSGFAISTRDNCSCDNMISLSTRDCSMASHRWGFTDLGCRDGVMISEHTPFSNDPATVIRTFMLPLEGGWHMRVHRVKLSQEYIITEGGFSIGLWDDYRESGSDGAGFMLKNRRLKSYMQTSATVKCGYCEKRPQPGMHLNAPFAAYPAYVTAPLEAGEYIFASIFGIHDADVRTQPPTVLLDQEEVVLRLGEGERRFGFI